MYIIKRILLGLCITLMIVPVLWVILAQYSQDIIVKDFIASIGDRPVNLAFENLQIKMLQKNERAINIESPHAQIYDLELSRIDLKSPKIFMYDQRNSKKSLIAQHGVYRNHHNDITLSDNVEIFDRHNYTIKTDKMVVDLNNFNAKLPSGVNALYKKNSLKAQNVEFDQKSNKAIFKGGVKLVIQPQKTL